MLATIQYIKARLNERSTWMLISGGVATAAALSAPWSYVAAGIGVVAALVPDGSIKKDDQK